MSQPQNFRTWPALLTQGLAFLTLVFASLAFWGCSSAPRTIEVEVGTGEYDFVPLNDGDEVTLVAGSQGGFHIWASVRTNAGIDPHGVELGVETQILDSDYSPEMSRIRQNLVMTADGHQAFLGWPAQLLEPACANGREVLLTMSLRDRAGAFGQSSKRVRVRFVPPPGYDRPCSPSGV